MNYIKMQTLLRRSMLAIILAWAAQAMPLRGAGVDSGIDIPDFGTNRPPVQTFYLPIPENDLLTALKIIENGRSATPPTDPMQTYVSLAVFVDGTVIYYDQWENGYDRDIANPNNLYSASNLGGTQIWGDGDAWKLICKASSQKEEWMKSTKAMEIDGVGCLVQVTTQQDYMPAEAVTFVPGVRIEEVKDDKGNLIGRKLVKM